MQVEKRSWHRRASGKAGKLILWEVIPLIIRGKLTYHHFSGVREKSWI
jgi:hypothetical protein